MLASLIKQRRDSIEQFGAAGRQDLVDKETAEIAVLEKYAPPAARPRMLEHAVAAAITETGATTPKDMGRVMKAVMGALAGKTRRRQGGQRAREEKARGRLNRRKLFRAGHRLIILKGNAQASHPSSMGPSVERRGPFSFRTLGQSGVHDDQYRPLRRDAAVRCGTLTET